MGDRIVPSIRRVKDQMCDGGLEAHLRHYALIFTLLPISPYAKITWSKNNKHFRVTIAVLIVYIWYMSIGNPEACFFGGGSRSQWQISPALTPCFHPKVLARILSHLIFQFIEIVVT